MLAYLLYRLVGRGWLSKVDGYAHYPGDYARHDGFYISLGFILLEVVDYLVYL
jgi:hypothetical protein